MSKNKWILLASLAVLSLLSFLLVYAQFINVPVSALLGTQKSNQEKTKTSKSKPVTAEDFIANSEKGLPEQIVRTIHLDSATQEPISLETNVIPQSDGEDGSQVALKVVEIKAEDKISREAKRKILGITISALNISKEHINKSQKALNAELTLIPRPDGYFGFALNKLDSRNE